MLSLNDQLPRALTLFKECRKLFFGTNVSSNRRNATISTVGNRGNSVKLDRQDKKGSSRCRASLSTA